MTHAHTYKQDRRAKWMAAFEQNVTRDAPQCCGKIEWNSATFYFNSGLSPDDAARKYVAALARTGG